MHVRVGIAVVFTVLQFAVVSVMLSAMIFKIVEFGSLEFCQHYTNWMWTMLTFFFAATLPAPLIVALRITDWRLTLLSRFIALTFIPLWGIVTSVLYLVIIMLLTGSEMLEDMLSVVSISILVVGNEVSHFFTHLVFFAWVVLSVMVVYFALNDLFAQRAVHRKRKLFWALVIYQVYIGPTITVLSYQSIFDAQNVYKTSINFLVGSTALFLLLTLASGVPLFFFLKFGWLGYEPLEPHRWFNESWFKASSDRVVTTYRKFTYTTIKDKY